MKTKAYLQKAETGTESIHQYKAVGDQDVSMGFEDLRSESVAQRQVMESAQTANLAAWALEPEGEQITTMEPPVQRVEAVVQRELNKDDLAFILAFLKNIQADSDEHLRITDADIRRVLHEVNFESSSKIDAQKMTMRKVKKLVLQMKADQAGAGSADGGLGESGEQEKVVGSAIASERDGESESTEAEDGFYTYGDGEFFLEIDQYNALDVLIDAYDVDIDQNDFTRGASGNAESAEIGEGLGALWRFVMENDLAHALSGVPCPGRDKRSKAYAGRNFFQILELARSGMDCHNEYAQGLREALWEFKRG